MPAPSSARLMGRGRVAMIFEEILDQAIAMLQRRGRLTYGTLKRQFQLDDAALERFPVEYATDTHSAQTILVHLEV